MRRIHSVVVLALALGMALSAFAAPPVKRKSRHHKAAAHARRAAARERTDLRVSRRIRHRHIAIATQKEDIALTIPAIPLHGAILPPLRGTHASLVRQNERTESDGLKRIEDDADLNEQRRTKALVAIPASLQLRVNEGLPMNRRYCRPWTAKFLTDLARAHSMRFHRSIQVNSAVRTVEYQRRLLEINGNAAPAEGDVASPHLTGAAVDIAKKGLSVSEVAWMRAYLLPLEEAGKIDVEEEFYQSCFHISVYKSYLPASQRPARHVPSTLLAEQVR
jgi:Family of unknown function (DUF5715)